MKTFPLRGVIGVVAASINELDDAESRQLQCVEIRADLLLKAGCSVEDVLAIIVNARSRGLATLFTLRHPTHGGVFPGTELERVSINQRALKVGASAIDLEWGTRAAAILLEQQLPLILSHHDFAGMPDEDELEQLTCSMSAGLPLGIKVVPTALSFSEAARMLNWVSAAEKSVHRIGFAMGSAGSYSRILATAFGSSLTYASFGKPTAPGQLNIDALLDRYRVLSLNSKTEVVIVVCSDSLCDATVNQLNKRYSSVGINRVAIAVDAADADDLSSYSESLRVVKIHE